MVPQAPDREPSRLATGGNGLGCWTFWRLLALVAAASRDGSRSEPELHAARPTGVYEKSDLANRHGRGSVSRVSAIEIIRALPKLSQAEQRAVQGGFKI